MRKPRESGQAAVETAIVMPLFVFTVLGLVQLSLMHQARLLTKYASYKAARSGSINRADQKVLEAAAISVMMPLITRENPIAAGSGGTQPQYGLYKLNTASDFATSFNEVVQSRNNQDSGKPIIEVTICHPLSSDVDSNKDFDDPDVNPLGGNNNWRPFEATKLAVQVTTYQKLIIPFANAFLWWASYGAIAGEQAATMKMLRMHHDGSKNQSLRKKFNKTYTLEELLGEARNGNYIMPVRGSYAMRMNSNFSDNAKLQSENLCHVPFERN